MIDLESLKYDEPKAAVEAVYHIFMEIMEGFCRNAKEQTLNDEIMKDFRDRHQKAELILKYNMLIIPVSIYAALLDFSENTMKTLFEQNWEERWRQIYHTCSRNKKSEEHEMSTAELCEFMNDYFYISMSDICRDLFNTSIIHERFIEKVIDFFRGNKE